MTRLFFRLIAAACLVTAAAPALAHDTAGYWVNSEGTIWRSGYGLCWRAGYWTPAMAVAECDPDLVAKPAVEASPAAKPAAAVPAAVAPEAPAPVGPAKAAFEKFTFGAETLFAFDKAIVRPEAAGILDGVVTKMNKYPEVELIVVTGHTDRIGKDAYNQALSERRAEAVRDYLVGKGVDSSRVQAVGRGEAEPVVGCGKVKGRETSANKSLIECLQPNRRVVIEIAVQRETGAL